MGDYMPVLDNINNITVYNDGTTYQPKYNKDTYFKRRNKSGYIIILISYITWAIFYKASLIGGDLEWIKNHLFLIGMLLFTAFLSYSILLWRIAFMRISKKRKLILYLIAIFSEISFLLYDHGELFDYHGMYNFLLFCLFILIGDGIALGLYFWYVSLGRRRFIISFSIVIFTIMVIIVLCLRYYMSIWGNGFLEKKIDDSKEYCKVRRPIPWFDLLPKGAQNFWTGSQSCSRKEIFDAFFDSSTNDKKLVVYGCPKDKKITYLILPDTRNMTFQEKQEEVLRESVMSKAEKNIYTYTKPVSLPDVEAVYITCGEQNKLVTRLAGRRVDPSEKSQPKEKLNVLLMYFDAVSRRQFFRNLPKTVKKLEELNNSGIMHLNQFFRYGVIGFNTNRNSLGLFAGLQLQKGKKGVPIWEDYRNRGYVTGAADDHCEDWDTTYNSRTEISLDHELISPFCLPEYHERTGNPHGNFKGAYSIRRRCITGRYVHNYVLDYTKQFINTYDGTNPWFFRSSFIEGHEGTAEVLSLMDDDLVDFFDTLTEKTLNHTAIIIMSDHGLHMGLSYLFSDQGFTEHKLPHLTTLIPENFLNEFPELRTNLDNNEQKLISAFDIYSTLRDILDFDINREPKEKIGEGVDMSTLTSKKSEKRSFSYLNDYLEEMDRLNKKNRILQSREDTNKRIVKKATIQAVENGTIVWGKSLLRHVPIRKCSQVLIPQEFCVCT